MINSSMPLVIRSGRPEDFDTCVEYGEKFFNLTTYAQSASYDGESIKRMLEAISQNQMFVVAEVDGEVVGMIGGVATPAYFNNSVTIGCELFWWVEPQYRDSGVGIHLIKELEHRAKQNNVLIWSMVLLPSLEAEKATKIYEVLGYKQAEQTFLKVL